MVNNVLSNYLTGYTCTFTFLIACTICQQVQNSPAEFMLVQASLCLVSYNQYRSLYQVSHSHTVWIFIYNLYCLFGLFCFSLKCFGIIQLLYFWWLFSLSVWKQGMNNTLIDKINAYNYDHTSVNPEREFELQ